MELTFVGQSESDNAYTLHDTYTIRVNGVSLGALLISHVNYAKFEQELTSGRWVARQGSYLWPLRRHLLDQNQVRANLSPALGLFRGASGYLTIIDEIGMENDVTLMPQQLNNLMQAMRDTLASKSDFVGLLNWKNEALRLGLLPLDMLSALAPYRGTAISHSFAVGRIPPTKEALAL